MGFFNLFSSLTCTEQSSTNLTYFLNRDKARRWSWQATCSRHRKQYSAHAQALTRVYKHANHVLYIKSTSLSPFASHNNNKTTLETNGIRELLTQFPEVFQKDTNICFHQVKTRGWHTQSQVSRLDILPSRKSP